MAEHPYFLARKRGERLETRGQPRAEFGHKIPSNHSVADGIFARWHWDGTRLVVGNDRYGFCPLFWANLPDNGVCVSPSLVSLVEQGAPTDLDIEALAVFFRLGFFVGNDTPFAAIKTVPPNAVLEWENGKLECHGRYPQAPNTTKLSRDEAIDRYIDLFSHAMAKRTPGSDAFAIPISGGRDSRHILLELHRTGSNPPPACLPWTIRRTPMKIPRSRPLCAGHSNSSTLSSISNCQHFQRKYAKIWTPTSAQ